MKLLMKMAGIIISLGSVAFATIGGTTSCTVVSDETEEERDPNLTLKQNVFLYEEVAFAEEIYLKCVGINANFVDNAYELNLVVRIQQWNTDNHVNKHLITSNTFSLKQVDMSVPTNMEVFLNCLFEATLEAGIEAIPGGFEPIDILLATAGFAANYITTSIEKAVARRGKTIKAEEGHFEPFLPYKQNGKSRDINLKFVIPEEYYKSRYTLVLSIDSATHIEKNIFLILRPYTKQYYINIDLLGGTGDFVNEPILCQTAEIPHLPDFVPVKDDYKFICWTSEKDKIATKIRDLYFYSYEEGETFNIYAYYQKVIDLESVVNIGENIYFKEGTHEISVISSEYLDSYLVKTKEGVNDLRFPFKDKKLLLLNLKINKTKKGKNHTLDNNNDFYLKKDYVGMKLENYFGYARGFDTLKPIDDYNWIGLDIEDVREYFVTLLFEIDTFVDLTLEMLVLEVDFFVNGVASILLK